MGFRSRRDATWVCLQPLQQGGFGLLETLSVPQFLHLQSSRELCFWHQSILNTRSTINEIIIPSNYEGGQRNQWVRLSAHLRTFNK